MARLNTNGTLDGSFTAAASAGVLSLALQADGAIIAGGFFRELNGQPRNFIGRFDSSGRLDQVLTRTLIALCLR